MQTEQMVELLSEKVGGRRGEGRGVELRLNLPCNNSTIRCHSVANKPQVVVHYTSSSEHVPLSAVAGDDR